MAFKTLDGEDFVVSAEAVQSIAWSTNSPTLTEFYTSSIQASSTSGQYYLAVYQTSSLDVAAAVQFDIAYGNVKGSGSQYYNDGIPLYTPATTTYGQYRSLVLEDEYAQFVFGDGTNQITSSDFWVLSIDRARYKEKLFPGTFNLKLSSSGGEVDLTDNSNDVLTQTFLGTTRVYQVVSGSDGSAYNSTGYVAGSGSYGLFLPDMGTIIFNPEALNEDIGLVPNRTLDLPNGTNQATFFKAIEVAHSFELNAEETITSDYVFVRSRNSEFNYSENPSFISGSTGEIIYDLFINNPQVYVTTIGLYNDSNELVSVAKLSKPLLKDFTKESLVRIKLDF
jgi:hypothetical protein